MNGRLLIKIRTLASVTTSPFASSANRQIDQVNESHCLGSALVSLVERCCKSQLKTFRE